MAAERLLRENLPSGAKLTIERENVTPPGLIPSTSDALRLAADAFDRVVGAPPLFAVSTAQELFAAWQVLR